MNLPARHLISQSRANEACYHFDSIFTEAHQKPMGKTSWRANVGFPAELFTPTRLGLEARNRFESQAGTR